MTAASESQLETQPRPKSRRLSNLHRITIVDIVLWSLRAGLLLLVVVGTIATLWKGTYDARHWFDFFMFGLTIGGVYALIALGYTMVYGVLRMINFAHADVMMVGAYAGMFAANALHAEG